MASISIANVSSAASLPLKKSPSSMALLCPSQSLRFGYLLGPNSSGISNVARSVGPTTFHSPRPRLLSKPLSVVSSAASDEELHSNIEVEKEKGDIKPGAQEAWKEVLASFKEQALKMQNISQESYDLYSKKAIVILKETAEQFKVQADKARYDLSIVAKEISEEGKGYISTATEKSPEHVKEVFDMFTSSIDDVHDISTLSDFNVGIPYGLLLSLGGFLSFMITGSISAIRFGVIPGIALLALSVSSLKAQKRLGSFGVALKGQAAISGLLFLTDIYLLSQKPSYLNYLSAFISAGVAAFYLYRILHVSEPEHKKGSVYKQAPED